MTNEEQLRLAIVSMIPDRGGRLTIAGIRNGVRKVRGGRTWSDQEIDDALQSLIKDSIILKHEEFSLATGWQPKDY